MTRQEYESNYLIIDGIIFAPRYIMTQIEVVENGKTILVDDYAITATAQQVYEEGLEQKNSPSLSSQIESLKQQIAETDYQIIKCYEYSLVSKELPYDITTLHNQRQALRDEINQLESKGSFNNDNI